MQSEKLFGQKTRRVNVTDLTHSQRQELFTRCMSKRGFVGFTKNQDSENQQTYYSFHYTDNA